MILGYFGMILGHIDGIVLLILFVGYIVYMIVSAKKAMNTYQEEEEIKVISMGLSLVYIVGGAIAIKFGGDFVVDSACLLYTSSIACTFLIRASIDLGLVGIVLLEFIVPYGMAELIVYLKKRGQNYELHGN